ncbi:hypothetical protein [Stenotrophomonas sp. GD04006]|uniref:hypothetical protein n=1 Tax=Stenotrophomonas sp. GD04006 TaxID=2975418 RepID=UPI001311E19B|nr:hypothetical protein [Stenotrophomonas sp. GD04006]MDH0552908.1 hypothetical protein [Stenotrophomonas sp. GD04006]HDS1564099.1 hypothetical protein [Stenotrophomonas maltophilia]
MNTIPSIAPAAPVLRYETALSADARQRQLKARTQLWAPDACYRAAIQAMPAQDVAAVLATWDK